MKRIGMYDLYYRFRNHKTGDWIIGENDAIDIYRLIKKYKPYRILDIGTGIGASAAIARFCAPDTAKVITIEANQNCIDIAKELIPKNWNIEILQRDMEVFEAEGIPDRRFLSHQNLPQEPFDFVIADNGGYVIKDNKMTGVEEYLDFVRLNLRKGALVYVDGCKYVKKIIKRFYSKNFEIEEEGKGGCYLLLRCIKPLRELEIVDKKMEILKKEGFV